MKLKTYNTVLKYLVKKQYCFSSNDTKQYAKKYRTILLTIPKNMQQ